MSTTKRYLKQIRRLSQALILSFAFNIGLSALFIYAWIKERPPTPYCELKPAEHQFEQAPLAIDKTNVDVIRHLQNKSWQQLVTQLVNKNLVENGYTQRDLAVACLANFHYFDLSKALQGLPQPTQHRTIVFEDGKNQIYVYPGLTDVHYQAIMHYALTERWPFTAEGLFRHLQKSRGSFDSSLADAFFLTKEFLALEMLLSRGESVVAKEEILHLIVQGNWELLSQFFQQQKIAQDLSPAKRQRLLLDYIQNGSVMAASLILKTDGDFALRKLNDAHILEILTLLVEKTDQAEQFALALLTSPRSDAVWELAAHRLYGYAGEPVPEKYQHHAALSRFISKKHVIEEVVPPSPAKAVTVLAKATPPRPSMPASKPTTLKVEVPKPRKVYVIQEGDTLWKIAGRFKIDLDSLKKFNRLSSDRLRTGEILHIPSQ